MVGHSMGHGLLSHQPDKAAERGNDAFIDNYLHSKHLNRQFYWQQKDNGNGSRAENIPSGDATLHCDFCHCN